MLFKRLGINGVTFIASAIKISLEKFFRKIKSRLRFK